MITLQETLNENVCYIKVVDIMGFRYYSIHDSDGVPLSVKGSQGRAFQEVTAHGMIPMYAH